MRIALDYNIITAEDRCNASHTLDLSRATNTDLEKVANYILYGKTPKGNSLPEAKEISTKHSTWKKKDPQSLDALMENIMFDEACLRPLSARSPYTNPKPKIDHEKDAGIPGMIDLWSAIAALETYQESAEDKLKKYYLRHLLIDMRKEQYLLKDLFCPTMHSTMALDSEPHAIDWANDSGFPTSPLTLEWRRGPRGHDELMYTGPTNWEWHTIATHTIDLTDPVHIYHVLDLYSALIHQHYDNPTASTSYLIYAVECLVTKAQLSPSRMHILVRKVDHSPNEVIAKELRELYGVDYAINYISTIWTKEICGAIARMGQIDKDEWSARNHVKKWKTCTKCHRKFLRDTRFFAKKRNTYDQLNPVCRDCQKKVNK
jgi:hypothetical protein